MQAQIEQEKKEEEDPISYKKQQKN